MSPGKALVIAPHADDETFGCGGTIYQMTKDGTEVHVAVMAHGRKPSTRPPYTSPIDHDTRGREFQKACELLGVNEKFILGQWNDGSLSAHPMAGTVLALDRVLDNNKYDYVFLPYPSHHQDHKTTYEASIAALRPGARDYVPRAILAYEYTYPNWQEFKHEGKLFVDISGVRFQKMAAMTAYKSQLHEYPHPITVEAYLALAAARGLAIGVDYAEMFYIIQMRGIPVWL
jgi:LmbE family N-acetylglucosaminyl deacetylase